MTDATPPKLGDLPQQSEFKVPTLQSSTDMDNSNGSPALQNARDSAYNGLALSASQLCGRPAVDQRLAMNTIQNHPTTQNMRDTVSNGPVADNVRNQSAKTSSEFRNLADSRAPPNKSTASGQPLT
ncbi:MAG: hypothetical protein Q9166_001529, partial [cf. Caloplaca sp. 2 TL-2023]